MLIPSPRHTRADLEHWRRCEALDREYLKRCGARLDRLTVEAVRVIEAFAAEGPCYVGCSWGKDSTVLAHLASLASPSAPVIWFPAGAVENPDCALVRDAFIARFSVEYREIEAAELVWADGEHDGAQAAFIRASRAVAPRYISGVRAEESGVRELTMRRNGTASAATCRPIGWWTGADVFGYLARHDLPIHPAYACTMAGAYDRDRVRVGTIGGRCGTGRGRAEWERRYYPQQITARRPVGEDVDGQIAAVLDGVEAQD